MNYADWKTDKYNRQRYITAVIFGVSALVFYLIATLQGMDFWLKFWIFMGIGTVTFVCVFYNMDAQKEKLKSQDSIQPEAKGANNNNGNNGNPI